MLGHREKHWLNDQFERCRNFPNCVGPIDGKHIVIQLPANAGSYYYNYKHNNSIVLMAVAGPDYECIYADVGTNERISGGGLWNKCSFSRGLEDGSVCLPFGVAQLPHVFVGDDVFALKINMMKPYTRRMGSLLKRESTTIDIAEPGEYLRMSLRYL